MKKRLIAGFLAAAVLGAVTAIPAQASCRDSATLHQSLHHQDAYQETVSCEDAESHGETRLRLLPQEARPCRLWRQVQKPPQGVRQRLGPGHSGSASASQGNVVSPHQGPWRPAHGVPTWFALRIAHVESNYNPHLRGAAGEYGVYQLKCATAKGIGFSGNCAALLDPRTNVQWGLKHLSMAIGKSNGNLRLAASKHNGGLGRRSLVPTYVAKVF